MTNLEEATTAARLVSAIWGALGRDDESHINVITDSVGTLEGRGRAARFRKTLGKSRRDCAGMGIGSYVYRLVDGSYVVRSTPVREPGKMTPLLVSRFPGGWMIGVCDLDKVPAIAETIELPPDWA